MAFVDFVASACQKLSLVWGRLGLIVSRSVKLG